ncbi:MAG: SBBP repeat-containing protein, partial [Deltaproteobacteria bacterium]|nr:SBBP repeat-containing protein [Deltaproteobacteria bacterium]
KPRIYQENDGVQQPVPGRYVLKGRDQVGIHVAAYDPGRPLVIDPVLSYSTYLGGGSNDEGRGIAVDSAGNIYVTGSTASADFPTTGGFRSTSGGGTAGGFGASRDASGFDPSPTSPFQASHGGSDDVFVTKLNAAGSALVYSTYIGGTGLDQGLAIAVDRDGNAHVTGVTESTNFPLVNPVQAARAGGRDAFVAKLNASGSALVYSTYLGGTDGDSGNAIAVDSGGNAYVTGSTSSANNFPTTAGAFQTTGSVDADFAFVTKLNASGSGLVYSTYLGGGEVPAPSSAVASRPFSTGRAIAVDSGGSAYVTGSTSSGAFPTTAGAFQAVHSGPRAEPGSRVRVGFDEVVYVTKLNAAGSGLVYSTYVGVGGIHTTSIGTAIAVDSAGHAFVAGYTDSIEFPTTGGAFQTALAGDLDDTTDDAFVTKLNATGSALVYSTYIGGRGLDQALGMAVDAAGNAHITGSTRSSNFPLVNPIQAALAGGRGDAFVTKLNAEGSALLYSTYLGGAGDELEGSAVDRGNGLVLDTAGNVYVIGVTSSPNFPTRSPFQDRRAGRDDAFVAKITPDIGEASLSGAGGPSGDVGAAEGGGGCLIATAAFGSPLAPQVQRLRALRDRYLLPHGAGRAIVAMYDRVSPPLAQRVAGSALLRDMVRIALVPVLGWAGLVLWSPGVGLGAPVVAGGLGVWLALQCGRRRRRHRPPRAAGSGAALRARGRPLG